MGNNSFELVHRRDDRVGNLMEYRYKKNSNIDAYGDTDNVIHCKFGELRKGFNFTAEFESKYPKFCTEYYKYYTGEKSVFADAIELVNYIERYNIPVRLYSNYVDEEFADIQAVKEWLMNEHIGEQYEALDINA